MIKPLKIGLAGTGSIAAYHLRAFQKHPDRVKLTAVCDIREEVVSDFARKAGVPAAFRDYDEMLRKADIDAVDICTPHDQHAPEVVAAASAGKDIFLEKPMGRNMLECRKMLAAAAQAGVVLMVGQDLRFSPHTRAIKRSIDKGELGVIRVARCQLIWTMPRGLRPGHWLLDGELAGGGMVISGIIHQIDLLRYYVGEVRRVSGVCRTAHAEFIHGAEEYACATLEFENGAIGDIVVISAPTRCRLASQYILFGDEGTIYSTPAEDRTMQFGPGMISSVRRDKRGGGFGQFEPIAPVYTGLAGDDPFVNEILHFARCCRTKGEPLTGGPDNLGTLKVVFAIYESARTGKKIDLSGL